MREDFVFALYTYVFTFFFFLSRVMYELPISIFFSCSTLNITPFQVMLFLFALCFAFVRVLLELDFCSP